MVQTKAELKAQAEAKDNSMEKTLQLIQGSISKLQETLSSKIHAVDNRIASMENKLHEKINGLEARVYGEIEVIKKSNENLVTHVESQHTNFNESMKLAVADFDNKLSYANDTISELKSKVILLERNVHRDYQHGRRANIIIDGIPPNVGDDSDQLEVAAIKILKAINVTCASNDIQAIHRLPSFNQAMKSTIILFDNRKLAEASLLNCRKLKHLKDLKIDISGLNDDSQIFIKPSLCPYYSMLAFNCRVIKREGLISSVRVGDDCTIKIKTLDEKTVKTTHESELVEMFPNFGSFKFSG